jgi:quercetin dioxygenase-like cupin family protein
VAFRIVRPDELEWIERPAEAGGAARYVARLTDRAGLTQTRGNLWRFEPDAKGRRHRDPVQEETFVVISGALTMYLGDPPERVDVPAGGVVHVEPGTVLQSVNHGDEELLVYAYGAPAEDSDVEYFDSAV